MGIGGMWLTALLIGDGVYTSIMAAKLGGDHIFALPPIVLSLEFLLAMQALPIALVASSGWSRLITSMLG